MISGAPLWLGTVLLAAAPSHDAEETAPPDTMPAYRLPPMEIRADPLPDVLGPFPLATRRIGPVEVERRPGGDLRDVLLPIAGVRVTALGAPYAGSSVSLRGSTTEQVLVLVDGRRRNPAQGGGADLASLPLGWIESVEVFRGGASAFWGSDAIGGALHVRTRKPEPGRVRLRLARGSHGERSANGDGALSLGGGWTARASSRYLEARGDYTFPAGRDRVERTIENGDVRHLAGDVRIEGGLAGARMRIDANAATSDRGVPGSEEFPTPTARLRDDRVSLGVRVERPAPWRPSLDVFLLRMSRRYREPGAAFAPVDELHRSTRLETDASLSRLLGAGAVRLAAGFSTDRLRSTTDGDRRRNTANVRFQLAGDSRPTGRSLRGMLAARLDATAGFEPFLSPRAGLLLDALPGRLTLRISMGLSHRTPDFDELFWPPRATAAGNPDLRPERGQDYDVGVALEGLPLAARVTIDTFVREVDDLIQWMPGASGIWRPHTIGSARIAGLEAEGGVSFPLGRGWASILAGSFTFLDARDRTGEPNVDGRTLVYRPRRTGTVTLLLRHGGREELEVMWRFVGDVFVTRANTKRLEGHALGEIRFRRRLGGDFGLDAAVTNVTDRAARDFRDYPLPGRAWKLGITMGGHVR